jgi:hypothetical protein
VIDIPTNLAANRLDPFQALGIDPNNCPSLSEAHADQVLDVQYIDQNGARRTYLGVESDFDWSLVKELLYGTRDGVAFYIPDDYVPPLANDPNVDLVNSSMTSKELRDALIAAAPVSDDALEAACLRDPPMNESDLVNVLQVHEPLSDQVLIAAIDSAALDSGTLKGILESASPLSAEVLDAMLARDPPLSAGDLSSVLSKQ